MRLVKREPDRAYLDNWLWVPKSLINVTAIQSALSFVFDDRYSGQQKVLALWKETDHHLLVPRAFWDTGSLLCDVVDCRPRSYQRIEFESRIRLDHRPGERDGQLVFLPTGDKVQQFSINAMEQAMGGVLQLACGKGKTCIALEHIARNKVPALIALDNTNLLYQWEKEIGNFLTVPGGIGYLMSGQFDWRKGIVLATYQTLAARADDMPEEVRRWFGGIYFDEGHHVSAPVFSKSVNLFYGRRYALTATPERDDGWHIICDLHIGKVLHKDLRQTMTAQFIFRWTGLELELTNPAVMAAVTDVNQEVHGSKVSTYFGQWRDRLWLIMQDTIDIVATGRKALVLSDSVDEVINLMTLWTRGPNAPMYTDIPVPTPAEVGETLVPVTLSDKEAKDLMRDIEAQWKWVIKGKPPTRRVRLDEESISRNMITWQQHLVGKKIAALLKRRQKKFLQELIEEPSTAGVMTYGVPPRVRQKFLDDRIVVFAITKYGKEGLDCPDLDCVAASTPFSSKNSLQQLMGRPTRPKPGKRTPIVLIWEDNVGQRIGMCQKLRSHLLSWPHEEGGPFTYTLVGHPKITCKTSTLTEAIGQ